MLGSITLNAMRLLELFTFVALHQFVRIADCLTITTVILERSNWDAKTWMEGYTARIEMRSIFELSNQEAVRFLRDYISELVQSGAGLDPEEIINHPNKSDLESSTKILLEYALEITVGYPGQGRYSTLI